MAKDEVTVGESGVGQGAGTVRPLHRRLPAEEGGLKARVVQRGILQIVFHGR